MEPTKNQIEWACRKERANTRRRQAYALSTLHTRTEKQKLREEREAAEELLRWKQRTAQEAHMEYLARIGKTSRGHRRNEQRDFIRKSKHRPCLDCSGVFHPDAMDYDHRDPAQKSFSVSNTGESYGLDTLADEIAKCDLVCANCHRVRTARRRAGLTATLPEPEYFI